MKRIKLHEKLDEMYKNEKSRKFVYHLIRAYFPLTNVEKVWVGPKRNFSCALTSDRLIGANDVLLAAKGDEHEGAIKDYLINDFTDSSVTTNTPSKFGGNKLGLTGNETSTYLSYHTFVGLYEWVIQKISEGDRFFIEFVKEIDSEGMAKSALSMVGDEGLKSRLSALKVHFDNSKKTTLGDLESLQKLRDTLS